MKIKTKLNLGVGLLFVAIIILSLVSAYAVFMIKKDTQNILKANHETLEYSRNMLLSLDNINNDENKAITVFESNLKKQIGNITENGEGELTMRLQKSFQLLEKDRKNEALKNEIREAVFEIMKLNLNAIKHKSNIANRTADTANWWIAVNRNFMLSEFAFQFAAIQICPIISPIRLKNLRRASRKSRTKTTRNVFISPTTTNMEILQNRSIRWRRNLRNTAAAIYINYRSRKKRLETLINNMNDPIIGLDHDGKVLFVNDEALKIIGLKSEDVIGKLATTLALTNDLIRSLIANDLASDKQKALPMKIFADGKESYFEKQSVNITIQPTGEDRTIDIGDVIILRNITLFKELDFAKTNFIATVSHELKTPISSIKMSLQLLENETTGAINKDQKQLIDSIKDDSQRLLKITGELLELSQLETGNIQLNIDKSNPYDIVNYAVEAVKTQAEQKQIQLEIDAESDLPNVKADSEKTSWVLINFLTNAIRYSSENSKILVLLKKSGNQISFEVTDKGKGIDKQYKGKVFDKYFQIPGSHKSGTGLGLAISKEFIEAQNGSIGVESELGLGSTFYFNLHVV